jgi:hypothetical protein
VKIVARDEDEASAFVYSDTVNIGSGLNAASDYYNTVEDDTLICSADEGVFDNDGGHNLIAHCIDSVSYGKLVLNETGAFTYIPKPNFNGEDSFEYEVSSGEEKDTAFVTLIVASVNDAPVCTESPKISGNAEVGKTLEVSSGEWNDAADGEAATSISYTYQWQFAGSAGNYQDISEATGASYMIGSEDKSRSLRVKIVARDEQEASAFAYSDTVNVDPGLNAVSDYYNTVEDDTLICSIDEGVFSNDGGDNLAAYCIEDVSHGDLDLDETGAFTYIPSSDFNGEDSFKYEVSNGEKKDTALVTLMVASVNDAPKYTKRAEISGAVEVDGIVTVSSGEWNDDVDECPPSSITYSYQWQLRNSNGEYQDIDAATTTSYTIRVTDVNRRIRVKITATDSGIPEPVMSAIGYSGIIMVENDPPTGEDKYFETNEDMELKVSAAEGLLFNANDPDGDELSPEIASDPSHGDVKIYLDGGFRYNSSPGYSGMDSFTYRISDGITYSEEYTVTINILAGNDTPIIEPAVPDINTESR